MAYRFSLAPVLRVRELAVEQEERTLARVHAEIERLRSGIARAEADLLEAAAGRQQAFAAAALPAMHLHASYAMAQELRARIGLLRKQLVTFEELRRQQVARYEEAYRGREVLAGLREKDRAAWILAQTRRGGAGLAAAGDAGRGGEVGKPCRVAARQGLPSGRCFAGFAPRERAGYLP